MMIFISSKLSLYVLPHDTVYEQKTQENMPGEAQINMNPFKDKNCRLGRIPVTSSVHVDCSLSHRGMSQADPY